jgi:hypothetical protein
LNGKNLAFGPRTKSDEGNIAVEAASESSSGPGKAKLSVTHLTGGFPLWTCANEWNFEGIAAPPFYIPAKAKTTIRKGSLTMQFAGPINQGHLKIDGAITLSKDFEVDGFINSAALMLARGEPIKPIGIRGSLEDFGSITIEGSGAAAKELAKVLNVVFPEGPLGVLDTVGGVLGSTPETSSVGKVIKGSGDILKKVPGLNKVFGSDSGTQK